MCNARRVMTALFAVASLSLMLFANEANAQCGANGTGQCGAPVSSQTAQQQLLQQQLNNGLALNNGTAASSGATSASASSSAAAPATAAYAPMVQGAMVATPPVYFIMPKEAVEMPTTTPAPQEGKTVAVPAYNLYQFAAFPGGAAAAGSNGSASASASATAPNPAAALAPTPIQVPTSAASSASGCASGSCGRGLGLGARLAAARAVRRSFRRASVSSSFSIAGSSVR